MARTLIQVNVMTGERTERPYTPEEEAVANAAYEVEQDALAAIPEEPTALDKLTAFLNANPDVRSLLD